MGVLKSVLQEDVLEQKVTELLEGKYSKCKVELPLNAAEKILDEMERWL
jgi:hypothetical protein